MAQSPARWCRLRRFEGIRNPAAHEDGLDPSEQVALEQLAALACWHGGSTSAHLMRYPRFCWLGQSAAARLAACDVEQLAQATLIPGHERAQVAGRHRQRLVALGEELTGAHHPLVALRHRKAAV